MDDNPAIQLEPVESSQIAAVGFDPTTNILAVRFKPRSNAAMGPLYHYRNATRDLFMQLKGAPSIGSFFRQSIKSDPQRFPYTKIDDGQGSA